MGWGFQLFFLLGEGGGAVRGARRGWGGSIFIENPRRGLQEGEGPRGREGVCGELEILGGGGVNIFFRGRNVHQVSLGFEGGNLGCPANLPGCKVGVFEKSCKKCLCSFFVSKSTVFLVVRCCK